MLVDCCIYRMDANRHHSVLENQVDQWDIHLSLSYFRWFLDSFSILLYISFIGHLTVNRDSPSIIESDTDTARTWMRMVLQQLNRAMASTWYNQQHFHSACVSSAKFSFPNRDHGDILYCFRDLFFFFFNTFSSVFYYTFWNPAPHHWIGVWTTFIVTIIDEHKYCTEPQTTYTIQEVYQDQ